MTQLVDPRQPRFGQAITGGSLLLGFVMGWPQVLPVLAVVLGGASFLGARGNLFAQLYRAAKGLLRLAPPTELEEAAPPRFANTVGFVFTGVASVLYFLAHAEVAAWSLGLLVSGLALLSAITGLCVGCELYVIARRVITRGRVAARIVVPRERAEVAT